jgi:hypothetical protein
LRVAGRSKREDGKGPDPATFEKVLHRVPQLQYYGKPEFSVNGAGSASWNEYALKGGNDRQP